MKKPIVFLLPKSPLVPVGGFKVVYEYANRLAKDGHDVTILYPSRPNTWMYSFCRRLKYPKYYCRYLYQKNKFAPPRWFECHSDIKHRLVYDLEEQSVPHVEGAAVIATAMETSICLNDYKKVSSENKFYLIQGYETWALGEEKLIETYKYALHKIVISNHLLNMVHAAGEQAVLIENGLDQTCFRKEVAYSERDKFRAIMLYHRNKLKGSRDGLDAMELVHAKFPQFRLTLFGVSAAPAELPSWVDYFQAPDRETHNRIYNQAAMYIGPSYSEGFSLTLGEAMLCGCAAVCSDIGGYTDLARPDRTALIYPVQDVCALADLVIRMIEDDALRLRIAEAGHAHVQQYTWERAYSKFRKALMLD